MSEPVRAGAGEPAEARHPLEPVFAPRSVVVVGASADPTKRGFQILRALVESGYAGEVYAVNPKGEAILGLETHRTIAELPVAPDLAVVCTPAGTTPDVVAACGERGIPGAVVLAVGFGESGEAGAELQARLRAAGREHGVRVVGPNTSGLLNLPIDLNLIGARGVRPGRLSLLVQSGNMALALMNEATRATRDGIAVCAGLGNEIDVGFGECLDFLGTHEETGAIVTYVEGLGDGRAFLEAASRVSRTKPIVMIKAARSAAGRDAARSHTGAIAGPWHRLRAGAAQAGIVTVDRSDELLHVAVTLANQPPSPVGTGVAVLSDGGGQGTLAVDALSEAGVPLARLLEKSRDRLSQLLGSAASTVNPVDLAGAADADPRVFAEALAILVADPGVGAVLVVGLFGGYGIRFAESLTGPETEAAERMIAAAAAAGRGLVVHTMYASRWSDPLEALGAAGVPVIESLDVACRCVAELSRRGAFLARPPWAPAPAAAGETPEVLRAARTRGAGALTEPEARRLLADAGLAFPPEVFCRTATEAVEAAARHGGEVALKVVSEHILHKSDAGGVLLGVRGADRVARGFEEIVEGCTAWLDRIGSGGRVAGVLVSPMLPPPVAELLVGAVRDPDVGAVLSLGAGGIWVELLSEVTHRVLPVSAEGVREMLGELRLAGILEGARGRPACDTDAVVRAALAVSRCVLEYEDVAEIEVNPLFVYPAGVAPVDARVYLIDGSGR